MRSTRWARKLSALCGQQGLTYQALAAAVGTTHATVSRYISGKLQRPSEAILRAMSLHWPRQDAVVLLCEHLHDEIGRAGLLASEIVVRAATASTGPDAMERSLNRLRSYGAYPSVVQLLDDLATVLDGADLRRDALRVAEGSGQYGKKK